MLGWIRKILSKAKSTTPQDPIDTPSKEPQPTNVATTHLEESERLKLAKALNEKMKTFDAELVHFRTLVLHAVIEQFNQPNSRDAIVALDLSGVTVTVTVLRMIVTEWIMVLYPAATLSYSRRDDRLIITVSLPQD